MATREEAVRFSLIDNVTKKLTQIQESVTGLGSALVKVNAAAQLAATGIQAVSQVGQAFNGLIKGASDAQFQLAGLQAALGATPEELAKLDAEARRVSETLGLFSKTEVLDALGNLGRAGLNATQAMEALVPVLNLATGGQTDLAFATDVTVNTLTQFGLSIDQAGKLANGLVTAANSSTTNVNDLGLALSYAATQARAAGNELEPTLEILAALAQTGIQGERAGTALRQVFAELANDGSKFATALRESYGITTRNLVQVIEQLRGTADGGKQALFALGIEARPAIQGLVQLAVPEFNKLIQAVSLTGTSAEDATKLLSDTYQAAAGRITNILTNLRNELATPILQPLGDALGSLAQKVSEFAKTEDFNLLKQAITDFATEAGAQIEQLIAEFDFKEASDDAIEAFNLLREQLETFRQTASEVAEVVGVVFDAINVAVRTVQTAFNAAVTAVASFAVGFTELSIAYAKFRGESQEVIDSLEDLKQSLIGVAQARFDQTGESAAKLGRALGVVADEGRSAASGVKAAEEAAAKSTAEFERLEKAIREIKTRAELDQVTEDFRKFAGSTESSAEQVDKLEGSLNRASKEIRGTAQEVQRVTLFVKDADGEYKSLGKTVEDVGDKGQESGSKLSKAARDAADDTERLAQAFRDANSAGQFEGALDQFERLKASGRLTAEQIAEIEKAAQEAGAKLAEAGEEGEDAFQQVADAADDAKDAVEGVADAAEGSGRTLQDVFAEIDAMQERSRKLNEEIQRQIDEQRERSNNLVEKEIELLDRKLSLTREELALADQLRQKYKLADQDRIDRYAQLIARQRELNREREEELRIIGVSGGSAGGGGAVGGGNGPNTRPVGTERPAPAGAGDASGDVASSGALTPRSLARLLAPELRRLGAFGG